MKNISACLCLAALLASTAEAADAGLRASEPAALVRMRVPEGWNPDPAASYGVAAAFRLSSAEPGDRFDENVNILVRRLDESADLESYSSQAEARILEGVPGARILASENVRIAGLPAKRVIFTGRLGGLAMQWMQAWFLHRDRVVLVTYSAERDAFAGGLASVESALESLQVV